MDSNDRALEAKSYSYFPYILWITNYSWGIVRIIMISRHDPKNHSDLSIHLRLEPLFL